MHTRGIEKQDDLHRAFVKNSVNLTSFRGPKVLKFQGTSAPEKIKAPHKIAREVDFSEPRLSQCTRFALFFFCKKLGYSMGDSLGARGNFKEFEATSHLQPSRPPNLGCTPRGSCNNTLLRRGGHATTRFLEGFLEGSLTVSAS